MVNENLDGQMIMFPFIFTSPMEVLVEEVKQGVAMIKGTLLREGTSTNGNHYTVEEMQNIAEQAEGMPIFVGTKSKFDPLTGILKKNAHADDKPNYVGEIIQSIFDAKNRMIRFVAKIFNTPRFPTLIEEVKAGWGVSIGGIAKRARLMIDEAGRMLTKVLGMVLKHVQLLPPNVLLGQEEARVDGVEIQETMVFYEFPEENNKPKINIEYNTFGISGFEIN